MFESDAARLNSEPRMTILTLSIPYTSSLGMYRSPDPELLIFIYHHTVPRTWEPHWFPHTEKYFPWFIRQRFPASRCVAGNNILQIKS